MYLYGGALILRQPRESPGSPVSSFWCVDSVDPEREGSSDQPPASASVPRYADKEDIYADFGLVRDAGPHRDRVPCASTMDLE